MRQLDDIVPPSRRTAPPPVDAPGVPPATPRITPRPRGRFPYITVFVAVVIVLLAAAALFYFANATVEVTPGTLSLDSAGSYTALPSTGDLPYQVITAQKTDSQTLPSSGTKQAISSAKGTITLYNTQSTAQKLIANTRFQTANGLIFRIHSAVTIPAGGSLHPGSTNTTVYADQPGSQYNVGPSSFTIPGLSGTPQYTEVTARSSLAMTGGASGLEPVVDPTAEATAVSSMQASLSGELASALSVPANYVLLPGAATTSYAELPVAPSTASSSVELQEQGTITAVVFPATALAKAIVSNAQDETYLNETFTVANAQSLTLSPVGSLPTSASTEPFTFSLSGTASLISSIDPTQIAAAVAGKSREAAQVALSNFPEVKEAILILRPFWRNSFPQDPASVKVVVENPQ